jgi:CHASE3 domain sensor protein
MRAVTPGLAFGFLAIVIVLVAGVLVALANLGTVYRATNAVAHTNDVKAQLEALLASLIDAETDERGFIITGNDSYLEPYERGVAATATETERVRQLMVDNPEQQADLERVAAETRVKLNELADAIQARKGIQCCASRGADKPRQTDDGRHPRYRRADGGTRGQVAGTTHR